MAIKGKKKSQSRGSQGQRRPAAAPRPVYTGRRHTPWYKTTEGRLIGGILTAALIGIAIWLIADAQNEAQAKSDRREALETYTTSARSLVQTVTPVADEMAQVPPAEADLKALAKDSKGWTADLTTAQAQAASLVPPEGANVANGLFQQGVASYLSAARTFESVAGAEGDLQAELLAQAGEERDQAAELFGLAIEALDEELLEVDGDPSNLTAPGSSAVQPLPGATPGSQVTIPAPEPEGEGEGGGGNAGGNGAEGGNNGGGGQGGGGGKKGGGEKGDGE